ncbi:MAG: alpha/beta hydrolase [Frankiaceae bacterium]
MSLLGVPLLAVVAALAVAGPAVAYLLWPRVRGPRWARAAERFGLVLAAQLCAVSLALVALNDYGQVLSSWSQLYAAFRARGDLVGTALARGTDGGDLRHYGAPGPSSPPVSRTAAPRPRGLDPPPPIPDLHWTGWSARSTWATRGAVAHVALAGRRTGLSAPADVYLPPAYFAGDRALPIVEVFTGYPGSAAALLKRLHYPDLLLGELRRGEASPMVLVMARPAVTYPRDTECTDVPGAEQALTYWSQDAPDAVAALLGLRPPAYGAIGDSTGGYCSVKLAMLDPGRFRAGVSLSGYFNAESDATTGDLFGGSARARELNDLRWRLRHLPAPRTSVLLATSPNEVGADGYATQQRFLALVRPPMTADELVLPHGLGHTFGTWILELPTALHWLSGHLAEAPG